jgi:hypothetical protein
MRVIHLFVYHKNSLKSQQVSILQILVLNLSQICDFSLEIKNFNY